MVPDRIPTGLARALQKRAEAGNPIRIGLIGAGEMGTDIVTRTHMMPGIEVAAIADIRVDNAIRAVDIACRESGQACVAASTDRLHRAMEAGQVGVVGDAGLLLASDRIDVVIEATGLPEAGADLGLRTIESGKHLVTMTVEADVTIGAFLKDRADRQGVVYTLGAGDEPSACMELIGFVSAMGHRVVAAGKGKNNPLNIDAVPDDYQAEARRRAMNPRLLVEFVDGSKTMIEMAALANATGLIPDKPGMHGPAAGPEALATTLIPERDGGVLGGSGRVDFSVGPGLAPGVFVIIEAEHPRIRERLTDLKLGHGPYYAFVRPWHLTSLEVPLTCARAVLYGEADMAPRARPVAEVCGVAKKDLAAGERLGQIGEYDYRGWIMEAAAARAAGAIPCGVLAGSTVTRPVRKGGLLTRDNTTPPAESKIVQLRALQDRMIHGTDGPAGTAHGT